MAYLLVDSKILDAKHVKCYKRVPDGRGIVFESDAKVLGHLEGAERVSASVLKEMLNSKNK